MTQEQIKAEVLSLRTLKCPGCKLPIVMNGYLDTVCPKGCGTFRFYPEGLVNARTGQDVPNQWVFYYRGQFSYQGRRFA